MDEIGKRDLPFPRGSDTEYLNASVPLFLLNRNRGLHGLFSPEMIRLFELDLSAIDPEIDGSI